MSTIDNPKERNRRLILKQIYEHPEISRSEIVIATGLSKAAVSSLVAELMESGLVQELGSSTPVSVGRPRILLSLVPDAAMVLGAEINDHECRVILTNFRTESVQRVIRRFTNSDLTVTNLLSILASCVAEVTQDVAMDRVLGLGVTVPGVVDPVSGTVLLSVILPWRNLGLGEKLHSLFPFPTALFSRGSAATWGEHWSGAGRNVQNMLYVRVGSGIVAGLVINGQPYLGGGFGAGEIGHMTVQPDGNLCRCGNRGCLATVATREALLNRVRQLLRDAPDNPLWTDLDNHLEDLSLDHVMQASHTENPAVQVALAEVGRWLAIALASTINLLNLDTIIVGGPLSEAGDALLGPLRAELKQRALPTHLAQVEVIGSVLGENAPSLGAASLVLHKFLSPTTLSISLFGLGSPNSLATALA